MSIINIRGTTAVDDPEYRYRMPSIMGKVEGRGNGIKTVISNVAEVASALHRDPAEVTKFFGCELGSQTTFNAETGRAVVNGAHNTPDLQTNLFKYIEKFVLCPGCGLPETIYKVKNGEIFSTCAACGAKEPLDLTHKLCVFILAQDKRRKKEKKDKKNKEKKKDKKDKGDDDDDDGKKKKKDKKEKKEKKDKKKKKDKKEEQEDEDDENDEEDNGSDNSEENAAAEPSDEEDDEDDEEVNAVSEKVEDATLNDVTDGMTAKETSVSVFSQYMQGEGKTAKPSQVVDYLKKLQESNTLMLKECAYIMVGSVFNENVIKSAQVKAYCNVLTALVNTDANKFMARHLIGAIEDFFGSKYPTLIKGFPLVLKQLYDEDVLEEDVILDWASQGVTYEFSPQSMTGEQIKQLRTSAEPFITWLKEADEGSDDE